MSVVYKVFCAVAWSWAVVVALITLWLARRQGSPPRGHLPLAKDSTGAADAARS